MDACFAHPTGCDTTDPLSKQTDFLGVLWQHESSSLDSASTLFDAAEHLAKQRHIPRS